MRELVKRRKATFMGGGLCSIMRHIGCTRRRNGFKMATVMNWTLAEASRHCATL